jgi:CRP-like cAMP-binding protein
MANPADVLASIPLFSMLPGKEVQKLATSAHVRTFPAGTVLTDDGEFGSIFTVIVDGTVTVTIDGRTVNTHGPGEFFGEMALIDRSNKRSATVVADTELTALLMTQPVFRPFALAHPEVIWALLELMVERVREAERRER